MLPLLALGRVMATPLLKFGGGIASKGIDLAQGAAKSAASQVEYEVESQSTGSSGPPSVNTRGASVNFDTGRDDAPMGEMFGGLDLAKVQSVIDDEGVIGPQEEGPKTVYKKMIQQLQNISQILLRTEATTKMLLAIDLERVRDAQSMDRQESVDLQDTDPSFIGGGDGEDDETGPGALARARGMLGGVYGKIKGGLSGMLGVGALILGFKFFREEIEKVTAKILEGFKAAYDYFTAEDFTMAKFQQDFGNIFWPKIQSIAMDFLDMLFTVIKESIFGASGDRAIQQQASRGSTIQKNLAEFSSTDTKGMYYNTTFGLMDAQGIAVDNDEVEADLKAKLDTMRLISRESDGRIQWNTFPDKDLSKPYQDYDPYNIFKNYDVPSILNAQPVIDGMVGTWDMLKGINLDEIGGISRTMDKNTQDKIRELLAKKTKLYQETKQTVFPEIDRELERLGQVKLQTLSGVTYTGQTTSQSLNGQNAIILKPAEGPMTYLNASTNTGGNVITNNTGVHVSMDATNNNKTAQALNAMGYT